VTPQPAAKAVAIDRAMAVRFMDSAPLDSFLRGEC
jgi:hypothetical protein